MNAFLAVQFFKLPINSVHDLLEKDYGIYMWNGGMVEEFFLNLPDNNPYAKAYHKAREAGKLHYITGTGKGIAAFGPHESTISQSCMD